MPAGVTVAAGLLPPQPMLTLAGCVEHAGALLRAGSAGAMARLGPALSHGQATGLVRRVCELRGRGVCCACCVRFAGAAWSCAWLARRACLTWPARPRHWPPCAGTCQTAFAP